MGEALAIFFVIWVWALLLLGLGAFIEWLGSTRARRKRESTAAEPSAGAD